MKKILSISLILCMLLALCAPLTVSAALQYDPGEITNTSETFDEMSNTGLGAYQGTPVMNETTGSIKDSEWDKAIPLTLNSSSQGRITNSTFTGIDADFYFLWDTANLYILEVYRNTVIVDANKDLNTLKTTSNYEHWRNTYTSSLYNIMLPSTTKMSGVLFTTMPDGNLTETGSIAEGVCRVRYYTGDIPNNNSKTKVSYGDSSLDVYTHAQKTENGYMVESRISWATLNTLTGNSYTPAADSEVGIKIAGVKANGKNDAGYHINHTSGNDYLGHDGMTLMTTKPTRTSVPTITPDTAYWAEALASTATEFEIATAERLYGLGYYLCSSGSDTDYGANNITYGKTFKLTADIDLNPGMNVAALAQADSLGYWETPNVWPTLDGFAGTFDGQGHKISGMYYGGFAPVSRQYSGFGFIARWYAGGDVKNLAFDNVYVYAPNCADGVGLIAGIKSHNTTDDKVSKIENVYVGANVLISAEDNTGTKYIGGLLGDSWASQQGLSLEISNVTFAGTIMAGTAGSGAVIGRIQVYAISVSDFVFYRTAGSVGKFVTTFSNNGTLNGKATELAAKGEMPRTKILQSEQDEAAFLAEADPYVVQTELGVMPVKLADMIANYKWQSTEASTDGKFSVRIVAEVASMKYDAVGFKVQLYKNDQQDAFHGNLSNTVVYEAVIADGQNVTAAAFNDGFMDGTDNKLFVITIDDLTAADTWTVEVTAVYKIGETTIESAIAKTTAVSAAQ